MDSNFAVSIERFVCLWHLICNK